MTPSHAPSLARAQVKRRDEPARDERGAGATDSREKDSAGLSPVALAAGTSARLVTQKEGAVDDRGDPKNSDRRELKPAYGVSGCVAA
jgi:hypothetical protein